MVRIQGTVIALLAAMMCVAPSAVRAADKDATSAEIEQLKKDVEQLRKRLNSSSTAMPRSSVDKMVDSKHGPNSTVTTKSGRLTISGLLQVWYYSIQNDNQALFNSTNNGVPDTNELSHGLLKFGELWT